ncbi:MAG TPA: PAS domain S-box protein [Ignavibacteriaceae bacterium]|nr:PAS domain S-box protein [Ignavibacteriaceae bacterium]
MNLTLIGFSLGVFSCFIIITIFLTLYYKTEEKFLKTWSIAVSIELLRFVIDIIQHFYGGILQLEIADSLISTITPLLFCAGIYQLKRKKFPHVLIYTAFLICVWIIYSAADESISLIFHLLPNAIFTGFLFVLTGIMFLGLESISVGKKITGISLIIWGIQRVNYPFLLSVEGMELFTYFFYFAVGISISVGVVIYYFQVINQELKQSKFYFQLIAENADDIIFHYSLIPFRKLEFISTSCKNILGYGQKEFYGDEGLIYKIVHPDDKELLSNSFNEESKNSVIIRFYKKNGSLVWLETKTSVIKDEKGTPQTLDGVSRDITEQKKTEEALMRAEKLFRAIVEDQSEMIVRWKPDGTRTFVNKAYWRTFGKSYEELVGTSFWPLVAEPYRARELERIHSLTPDSPYSTAVHESILPNGKTQWQEWSDRAFFDEHGSLIELQSVGRDITERVILHQKIAESEERYRLMFELSSAVMLLLDAGNGKIIDANIAACKFYGYSKNQLIEKFIAEINVTPLFDFVSISNEIKNSGSMHFYFKHQLAGGEIRDVEAYLTSQIISGKELFFEVIHDVSEKVKTENELERYRKHLEDIIEERTIELQQSEQRFKIIAENSTDSIVLFDKDLRVQYTNPAVLKRNAYLKEDILGKIPSEFGVSDSILKETLSTLQKVFSAKIQDIRDVTMQDGRIVEFLSIPIFNNNNDVEMVLSFGREVTERKKLEESLNEALKQEKEISMLKTKLISTVSHEFRTPLTAILSSAELLERYGKKWDDMKYYHQLNRMRQSINNLTALMEDVLALGKIESKKIKINPVEMELEAICRELLDEVKLTASDKHKFEFVKELLGHSFKIDEKLFRLIFSNLLSNAVKYSPDGGKIIFKISESSDELHFYVSDEGIGINTEDIKKLFKPFFRGENAKNIPGTGLGLPIVKEAVDLCGGRVSVSVGNMGTTFTVSIPKNLTPSSYEKNLSYRRRPGSK